MNVVEQFLSDTQQVFDFMLRSGRTFISRTYGTLNTNPTLSNILFIVALLPVVFGFGAEIILSFILSFRVRKLVLFNPFKASIPSISSFRLPSLNGGPFLSLKRGNVDRFSVMPLANFKHSNLSLPSNLVLKNQPIFLTSRWGFGNLAVRKLLNRFKSNKASADDEEYMSDDDVALLDAISVSNPANPLQMQGWFYRGKTKFYAYTYNGVAYVSRQSPSALQQYARARIIMSIQNLGNRR